MTDYLWQIRIPDAGATGVEFARGRLAASDRLVAHALPETVDVEVRTEQGELVAVGRGLTQKRDTPMDLLSISGQSVQRTNGWPKREDIGLPVILCGGEVGILRTWWNTEDGREWRWTIELHNAR
ncbi:MAG: DUF7712 family protein [Actinomycetota bacterium]